MSVQSADRVILESASRQREVQPHGAPSTAWSGVDRLLVAGLIIVGLVLRLPLLSRGLWRDEGSTYFDIAGSLAQLWGNVRAHEWTPPLYFLFERGWITLAGTGETALRAPSLVFSLALVVVVYASGLRWEGRLTAFVAALMATAAPLAISLAAEARAYALAMLLSACAVHAFLSLLYAATPQKRRFWALSLVVFAALLICTHFTGYVVIGALGIAAFVRAVRHQDDASRWALTALALALVLTLPVAGLFVHDAAQQMTWRDHHDMRLLPLIDEHLSVFGPFGAMNVQVNRLAEIGAVASIVALARSRAGAFSHAPTMLFGFIVACGIAVSTARSLPGGQHLAVYAPFAWLLFAALLSAYVRWLARPSPSRLATQARIFVSLPIAYVLIGGLVVYPRSYRYALQPISGAAALTAAVREATHRPVLLVACPDYLGPALAYYLRGTNDQVRGVVTWQDPWFYSVDPAGWKSKAIVDRLLSRTEHLARRRHALIALAVDWTVPSYNGIDYGVAHSFARREARSHRVLLRRQFSGSQESIELILFAPRRIATNRTAAAGVGRFDHAAVSLHG